MKLYCRLYRFYNFFPQPNYCVFYFNIKPLYFQPTLRTCSPLLKYLVYNWTKFQTCKKKVSTSIVQPNKCMNRKCIQEQVTNAIKQFKTLKAIINRTGIWIKQYRSLIAPVWLDNVVCASNIVIN